MATTMKLIAKTVLGSSAASVTFSSIPGTGYTDLVIIASLRNTAGNGLGSLRFNSDTGSNYSYRGLRGNGSTATSFSSAGWVSSFGTGYDEALFFDVVPSSMTASTFASTEIYIPNYAGSANKSVSISTVEENNATSAEISVWAGLWSSASAITSVTLLPDPFGNASNFAANSSAYLFGITKS